MKRSLTFSVPLLVCFLLLSGCGDSDPTGPEVPSGELTAVVVNSVELTLTVFPLSDPGNRRTVALGPEGSPVGGAVHDGIAAIPMGIVPAVAIVDLAEGTLMRTIALPEGSGATGAHFVNDSIVLIANPMLASVSPVNVRTGVVGGPIETGAYPQGFVEASGRIFVVNSELGSDFAPARNSTLTVLDSATFEVVGTVQLSSENAGGSALGSDGSVFVMNSGRFGGANGTLSIVDPGSLLEIASHEGFGEFPGSIAATGDARILASSWAVGIVEWDFPSGTFIRGPDNAVAPSGVPSSAGVAVDPDGGIWSLFPECTEPSMALRLDDDLAVEAEVPVGVCPASILFTVL